MEKTRMIEVRTPDGKPIISFLVTEKEVSAQNGNQKQEPKGGPQNGKNHNSEIPMTEPQKRYLFRILADHGIEGEDAYTRLKKLFQVENLKEVTKNEASKAIQQLLEEAKGGERDGVPF